MSLYYLLGKDNVVVDALSRLSIGILALLGGRHVIIGECYAPFS